jgi:hypothetical protein
MRGGTVHNPDFHTEPNLALAQPILTGAYWRAKGVLFYAQNRIAYCDRSAVRQRGSFDFADGGLGDQRHGH